MSRSDVEFERRSYAVAARLGSPDGLVLLSCLTRHRWTLLPMSLVRDWKDRLRSMQVPIHAQGPTAGNPPHRQRPDAASGPAGTTFPSGVMRSPSSGGCLGKRLIGTSSFQSFGT